MNYATFLCPSSADALHAFDCLLQRFFQYCLGIRVPQSQIAPLLLMFNIDSLGNRRRTLANAFAGRLKSILNDDHATGQQKLQAKKTQIALNSSEACQQIVPLVTKPLRKDQTMSMRQNKRVIISRNMRRPVRTLYLFRWCTSMISRLGELTALPAYLHISSYATLAMLSLINRSNACNCRTYPRRCLPTCVATGQQL